MGHSALFSGINHVFPRERAWERKVAEPKKGTREAGEAGSEELTLRPQQTDHNSSYNQSIVRKWP
jgi:hypothetical protein